MSHPNASVIKKSTSTNEGRVKSWQEQKDISQALLSKYKAFTTHFEKVHYDITTVAFIFLLGFQYFLARTGYASWSEVFLSSDASRLQVTIMTIIIAIGMGLLSAIVAELLSGTLSPAIFRWRVKQLAEELSSVEMAEEQVTISVKSQRRWGIAAAVAVLLLAGYGLGTRAAINTQATTAGLSTEQLDTESFLQALGTDTTQKASLLFSAPTTSVDLTKRMSVWSVFFFILSLISEMGAGIFLWTSLRFYISVARPLRKAEHEQERLFQEIMVADQRIDALLREAFPTAALDQIALQLGNVVAATAERVRFRYPHDPEAYLATSSRFIDELKPSNSANGRSYDPAKDAHVTVETSDEA